MVDSVGKDGINEEVGDEMTEEAAKDTTADSSGGTPEEVIEFTDEEIADHVVFYALDQAVEMLEEADGFTPFTIVVRGEELFIEEHPGDDGEECYASAQKEVFRMALISEAYAFCYDGFVDLDDGQKDAIIVERARKGDEVAEVIVKIYEKHGDHYHFDDTLYNLGDAPSFYEPNATTE